MRTHHTVRGGDSTCRGQVARRPTPVSVSSHARAPALVLVTPGMGEAGAMCQWHRACATCGVGLSAYYWATFRGMGVGVELRAVYGAATGSNAQWLDTNG